MSYIFETHLHTCQASKCGVAKGCEYIDYMKRQGYDGIIVTDHFFNGNSAVPKDLPWEERVDMYMSGYEDALKASKGSGFTVLFGIEYNFEGDEYLLYGPDRKWLCDNPDILACSREEVYERVHACGGIMVQAHPYRERGYLSAIHLTAKVCDGIEAYNAANPANQNALAYEYAKELKVPMTAGSDIHFFYDGDKGAMRLDALPSGGLEYGRMVMEGKAEPVIMRNGKAIDLEDEPAQIKASEGPSLPVYRH